MKRLFQLNFDFRLGLPNESTNLYYNVLKNIVLSINSRIPEITDGEKNFDFSSSNIEKILETCIEVQNHYKNSYSSFDPSVLFELIEKQNISFQEAASKLSKINDIKQINFTDENNTLSNIILFFNIHLNIAGAVADQNLKNSLPNEIFQKISANYITPTLSDWFVELTDDKIGTKKFIDTLLNFCGSARNKIAIMNNDDAKDTMGKLSTATLFDSLNNPAWQSWFNKTSDKIKEAIIQKDFTVLDLNINPETVHIMHKHKESTHTGRYHHPKDFTTENEQQTHSASYNFSYHYDETKNIIIDSITCIHLENSSRKTFDIGEEIYKTIMKNDFKESELKDDFLSILWEMTHSTLYQRGQAAIIKFVLSAIAHEFRLDIKFSPEWSFPNINHDQQGLVELYKENFVSSNNHQYIKFKTIEAEELTLVGDQ